MRSRQGPGFSSCCTTSTGSGEEVGKVLGVHRLTVLRRLERARHELAEGTKERLESELRLDPPDVESLLQLIQSRLDVSLQGALAARSHEVQHAVPE